MLSGALHDIRKKVCRGVSLCVLLLTRIRSRERDILLRLFPRVVPLKYELPFFLMAGGGLASVEFLIITI